MLENRRCTGIITIRDNKCYSDDGGGQDGIQNIDQAVWHRLQQIRIVTSLDAEIEFERSPARPGLSSFSVEIQEASR